MNKPKIICTLGTTTDDPETIEEMVKNGMSCIRLNTAYADLSDYQRRIGLARQADKDIGIMLDIKGPQPRLCADAHCKIETGDRIMVGFDNEPLHFSKRLYFDVEVGDIIFIENGTIRTKIYKKEDGLLILDVLDPGEGVLHKQMGVSVPGRYLNVERLSNKDRGVIDFAVRSDADYIALSFARNYADISNLQREIDSAKKRHGSKKEIGIEAKIEDYYGVRSLDKMIAGAKRDGVKLSVMVARGDIYVEFPHEDLPLIQNYIVRTCKAEGIPVTIATGLLESMQHSDAPTRAEVCDVYNAVRYEPDALMLSGETSNGRNPALAVKTLSRLIERYSGMR